MSRAASCALTTLSLDTRLRLCSDRHFVPSRHNEWQTAPMGAVCLLPQGGGHPACVDAVDCEQAQSPTSDEPPQPGEFLHRCSQKNEFFAYDEVTRPGLDGAEELLIDGALCDRLTGITAPVHEDTRGFPSKPAVLCELATSLQLLENSLAVP